MHCLDSSGSLMLIPAEPLCCPGLAQVPACLLLELLCPVLELCGAGMESSRLWLLPGSVLCHAGVWALCLPVPTVIVSFRWEQRELPNGRVYYVDHNNKTTTWERPLPPG